MGAQLSFVLSQIMRLTERQTDGFLVVRPRCMQCMQRSKNRLTSEHCFQVIADYFCF